MNQQVWEKYLTTGQVPEGILDSFILASWSRCKKYGLNPMVSPKVKHLDDYHLNDKLLSKTKFLKAYKSVIDKLGKSYQSDELIIIIGDKDGYLLEINGDIKLLNLVKEEDLKVGALWLEEIKGNNAIGTVIATSKPCEFLGFDHYFPNFHNWYWCGEPIFHHTGELMGAIAILHPYPHKKEYISGLVALAAQNIQQQLLVNDKHNKFIGHTDINTILIDSIPHSVVVINNKGLVTYFNHNSEKFFSTSANMVIGKEIRDVFNNKRIINDDLGISNFFMRSLKSGEVFNNVCFTSKKGLNCIINIFPIIDEKGKLANVIGIIKESAQNTIKEDSDLFVAGYGDSIKAVDNLTKLYNHKYFHQKLAELIDGNKGVADFVSVLLIDIDHFKHYNEVAGYEAGDKLLAEVAVLLRQKLRFKDIIARYGGDDFAIILSGAESELARIIAERLKKAVEDYPFDNREVQPKGKITVSIGVATYPESAKNKEELIHSAEQALAQAQMKRTDKISFYFKVFDELKEELNHSDLSLLNTIRTLITVINAKDKYTYGHSERVVYYSTALAEKIDLSPEEIRYIRYGAFLHDIGKIEINRDILNKITPLTESEWNTLKNHPRWGAEIIKPVSALQDIIPQILFHHERYDGKGYPNGIAGEDIPLAARILSIADCFDAMTTDRPYQQAKTIEQALNELRENAGTQFDPELISQFLEIIPFLDFNK